MERINIPRMCGTCKLDPTDAVVAGSYGTWTLTYTAGEWGIDDGGTILILWRFATDWGTPQTQDRAAADYLTVATDGTARVRAHFDSKAHIRPWRKGVVLDVFDDGLLPGEQVVVTYGDTSGGSRGSRAQTFCEDTFEFRVLVNPIATGEFTVLEDCPEVTIIPGPATAVKAIAPTQCKPGEPRNLLIKFEDVWGNPTADFSGDVSIAAEPGIRMPSQLPFAPDETGIMSVPFSAPEAGVYRFDVTTEAGLATQSNPLECQEDYLLNRFWGDLHGQSEGTVGTNTVADYYRFARDKACTDFSSHQGNDFQITRDDWQEITDEAKASTTPGEFVAFLGYEWSGNAAGGGDHNVFYLRDDEPIFRSGHALIPDKSDLDTDRFPIEALHDELRDRDAILCAHVGGRRATLSRHDEEVKRLVEVYSAWGEFEWMLTESLALGHTVGVVANSDGHKGRPGASYPGAGQFGVYGGLTCIYASELTREALFQALYDRRCYGTSGQRIIVRFSADDLFMGMCAPDRHVSEVEFAAQVYGTAPIESVELFADAEVVAGYDGFAGRIPSNKLRVSWGGARIRGRDRAAHWAGNLQVDHTSILDVAPYAFDSPSEGIVGADAGLVMWRSMTTGDEDGVILHLADPDAAVLRFNTPTYNFMVAANDLQDMRPHTYDAGGVGLHVTLRRLPEEAPPTDVSLQWHGDQAGFVPAAYWLRVLQTDGAKAWTSPIFLRD